MKHTFAGKEVDVFGKGLSKATEMFYPLRVDILHKCVQACMKERKIVDKAEVAYF